MHITEDVFPVPGGPYFAQLTKLLQLTTRIKLGMFPNLTIDFNCSTATVLPKPI
jgi:hypothetical protein